MSDTFDHEADAWDSLLFGQDSDGEYISWDSPEARHIVRPYTLKTCRYCGQGGLSWVHTGTGWRLASREGIHNCGGYRSAHSIPRDGERIVQRWMTEARDIRHPPKSESSGQTGDRAYHSKWPTLTRVRLWL